MPPPFHQFTDSFGYRMNLKKGTIFCGKNKNTWGVSRGRIVWIRKLILMSNLQISGINLYAKSGCFTIAYLYKGQADNAPLSQRTKTPFQWGGAFVFWLSIKTAGYAVTDRHLRKKLRYLFGEDPLTESINVDASGTAPFDAAGVKW